MITKYILPVVAIALAATSCVEDKGNYEYTELNEVSIDEVEERYNVLSQLDDLVIKPKVTGSLSGEQLRIQMAHMQRRSNFKQWSSSHP